MAIFGSKTEEKKDKAHEHEASSASPELKIPTVLIQPRISEKAGKLSLLNKYVFKVLKSSNKVEVKKAVESFYKVKVVQVNMVNNKGKVRNFGRTVGKTSSFKKAIVTLRKGDKIEGLTE